MSAHPHGAANPRTAYVVRWSALFGLFIALLTLALSLPGYLGLRGNAIDVLGAAATTVLLAGPFLLVLASLRWNSRTAARVTWLLCGVVVLSVGGMLIASGVGVFLIACGAGLVAAWWISR
jgi:hypothetical protein